MTDNRKKRLSMLDNLAAGTPPPPPGGAPAQSNRALRAARDAVDWHNVWDLDPTLISDTRVGDRLDIRDVDDLRDSIETSGQTVPILVRRDPADHNRYLLVYGARRLEAIRTSDKVGTVRALVANLDDDAATRAQITENLGRRDLTFIERALFAHELIEQKFGSQKQVAEVLTVSKSSVSMAVGVVEAIGRDLARTIGPAHGIGRPRWDALARDMARTNGDSMTLIQVANDAFTAAKVENIRIGDSGEQKDPSVAAFEAVADAVTPTAAPKPIRAAAKSRPRDVVIDGTKTATIRRTRNHVQLDIQPGDFADWLEHRADLALNELHAQWKNSAED